MYQGFYEASWQPHPATHAS